MKAALTIAVLLAMPVAAQGKPLTCVLWPKTCEAPVPVPASPEPAPAQAVPVQQPKVEAVRHAKRVPFKFAKAKAKKKASPKPKIAKPKSRVAVRNDGRDLSSGECTKIRLAGIVGHTIDDVKAAARARNITMTEKQIEQAIACLAGKR